MNRDELQEHVASTYWWLRSGLGIVALAFPIVLTVAGWGWYGVPLQGSLSAYYLAEPSPELQDHTWRARLAQIDVAPIRYLLFYLGQTEAENPMRSWFVGTLFVIGVVLILYKGFSRKENRLLNFAGLSALGVAIFPTGYDCGTDCLSFTLHGIFAVLTFSFTAWVAWCCSGETLKYLPGLPERRHTLLGIEAPRWLYWGAGTFRLFYRLSVLGMIGLPAIVVLFHGLLGFSNIYILLAEWIALWCFAAYWLLKSWELSRSVAELKLLRE
jgi:hypothetical protein